MSVDLGDRFWAKVQVASNEECWPWIGARYISGYGKLYTGRDQRGGVVCVRAHRLSWELHHARPIPPGMGVLHSCDNPPCVNPQHLRIGTGADNVADRSARGRNRDQYGEANSNVRLTEAQVRAILSERTSGDPPSQQRIAARYGVSQAQISRILRGESWAYLQAA